MASFFVAEVCVLVFVTISLFFVYFGVKSRHACHDTGSRSPKFVFSQPVALCPIKLVEKCSRFLLFFSAPFGSGPGRTAESDVRWQRP